MPAPSVSRTARPLLAAFASALLPGAGQWLAGEPRRARVLLGVDAAVLGVLLVFFHDKVSLLDAFVRPSSLAALMIVNIVLLAYRVWAADDAYRAARPAARPGGNRTAVVVGTAALVFVLFTPHVVFGYYDLVGYSLLNSVFGSSPSALPATTAPATATAVVV